MLKDRQSVLLELSKVKKDIAHIYGIKKLGLFGSYSKNTQNIDSDIDLIVELEKKDFFIKEDVREYLEKVFGKSIDLGTLNSLRGFYKAKIEKDIIYV